MTNPKLISTAFAENGTANDIPNTNSDTQNPQLATMDLGFPNITQKPISEGGIPPERADFNGILKLYGQHIVHLNKGLGYEFSQDFATEIGGYPLHARIILTNGNEVKNTVPNNINNPNADMTGWELTGGARTDAQLITWSGRTQEGKNKDIKSIYDFKLGSDKDFSAALSRAFESGSKVLFPKGDYNFSDPVENWLANSGIFSFGGARMLWDGTGVAGGVCIYNHASNFSAIGLEMVCTDKVRIFLKNYNSSENIENLLFENLIGRGGFYMIRTGSDDRYIDENSKTVSGLTINKCINYAPTTGAAGHFPTVYTENVQILSNRAFGGRNTASYGLTGCFGKVIIANNVERGMVESGNGAEASIQLENSQYVDAIVIGNDVSHNIWLSGVQGVSVAYNHSKSLRVSNGNETHGANTENNFFIGGKCTDIQATQFSTAGDKTYSGNFKDVIVDPQYATKIGRNVPARAIQIQGQTNGKEVILDGVDIISKATANQVVIIGGSKLNYNAKDCNFGDGDHLVTSYTAGIGSYIESNVKNPVFKQSTIAPNSLIVATVSPSYKPSVSQQWIAINTLFKLYDPNGILITDGVNIKNSDVYNLSFSLTANDVSGNRIGFAWFVNGVEVLRSIYDFTIGGDKVYSSDSKLLLSSGDKLELRCYSQSTNLTIKSGQSISYISVSLV